MIEEWLPLFAGAGRDQVEALDIAKMGSHPRGQQVRALWAEYNTLRVTAGKGHGRRARPLELTARRSTDVARAIREHGFEAVLAALRFRGEGWAASADAWDRYSLHMWTDRSVGAAVTASRTRPQAARRGAGQGAMSRLLGLEGDSE